MIESSWRVARGAGAVGLVVAALLGALPAAAQAPLACSAANAGAQACQGQNVCRCRYSSGGTMTREPQGYAWDCASLLYGTCPPDSPYTVLSMAVTPGPLAAVPGGGGGGRVRAAQSALLRLGYQPGPIDGVSGPRTASALRAFQRAQRLPETGSLTPETLSRLGIAG